MKRNFILLIASLALWPWSNTVWGQQRVLLPQNQKEQVMPRRGDANTQNSIGYIIDKTNVNNEFGAGETATILNGNVNWPNSNSMHTTPNSIQLGSEYSKNIVINSYNAGGYAAGWIDMDIWITPCGGTSVTNDPAYAKIEEDGNVKIAISPSYINNGTWTDENNVSHTTAGWLKVALNSQVNGLAPMNGILANTTRETSTKVVLYVARHGKTANDDANHYGRFSFNKQAHISPYTTTSIWDNGVTVPNIDMNIDDGVCLVQTGGSRMYNQTTASVSNVGVAPSPANNNLNPYKRPTTVAISGTDNTFNQIKIRNLQWWYQRFHVQVNSSGLTYTAGQSNQALPSGWDCCHYDASQTTITITNPNPWEIQNGGIGEVGNTFLDAAVQLISGASVCVKGNIEDATDEPGSEGGNSTTTATDAMMIFPIHG
ncbi:MAG: hypothetical protein LBH90_08905, partial [Tannerella sp.]|nr:hypothetical protein [Tannerella sp.]